MPDIAPAAGWGVRACPPCPGQGFARPNAGSIGLQLEARPARGEAETAAFAPGPSAVPKLSCAPAPPLPSPAPSAYHRAVSLKPMPWSGSLSLAASSRLPSRPRSRLCPSVQRTPHARCVRRPRPAKGPHRASRDRDRRRRRTRPPRRPGAHADTSSRASRCRHATRHPPVRRRKARRRSPGESCPPAARHPGPDPAPSTVRRHRRPRKGPHSCVWARSQERCAGRGQFRRGRHSHGCILPLQGRSAPRTAR